MFGFSCLAISISVRQFTNFRITLRHLPEVRWQIRPIDSFHPPFFPTSRDLGAIFMAGPKRRVRLNVNFLFDYLTFC